MRNPELDAPTVCEGCPWLGDVPTLVPWLFDYLGLQDSGCPLSRHELKDEHWRLLRKFRLHLNKWQAEQAKLAEAQRKGDNG